MSMHFRDLADKVAADGAISADDILALRRVGWSDGAIQPDEAEAIFVINDALGAPDAEWSDFFVEALSEYVVSAMRPQGYVTDEQARWVIERIDHDGRLDSLTELQFLIRLFERSTSVPDGLREYALSQVEHAVLEGEGPTRCGGTLQKGNVTDAEAKLMRRIVFSTASERPAAVSRKEAEMLYRIKDAALGADNTLEWKRLFVQAVGNYLMAFSSYAPLPPERASELEAFMNDVEVSPVGFLHEMARNVVLNPFNLQGSKKAEAPDRNAPIASARQVDQSEQDWLRRYMDANGKVDEYDRALLDFIAEETSAA